MAISSCTSSFLILGVAFIAEKWREKKTKILFYATDDRLELFY